MNLSSLLMMIIALIAAIFFWLRPWQPPTQTLPPQSAPVVAASPTPAPAN